jgi:hypothetical protein
MLAQYKCEDTDLMTSRRQRFQSAIIPSATRFAEPDAYATEFGESNKKPPGDAKPDSLQASVIRSACGKQQESMLASAPAQPFPTSPRFGEELTKLVCNTAEVPSMGKQVNSTRRSPENFSIGAAPRLVPYKGEMKIKPAFNVADNERQSDAGLGQNSVSVSSMGTQLISTKTSSKRYVFPNESRMGITFANRGVKVPAVQDMSGTQNLTTKFSAANTRGRPICDLPRSGKLAGTAPKVIAVVNSTNVPGPGRYQHELGKKMTTKGSHTRAHSFGNAPKQSGTPARRPMPTNMYSGRIM